MLFLLQILLELLCVFLHFNECRLVSPSELLELADLFREHQDPLILFILKGIVAMDLSLQCVDILIVLCLDTSWWFRSFASVPLCTLPSASDSELECVCTLSLLGCTSDIGSFVVPSRNWGLDPLCHGLCGEAVDTVDSGDQWAADSWSRKDLLWVRRGHWFDGLFCTFCLFRSRNVTEMVCDWLNRGKRWKWRF